MPVFYIDCCDAIRSVGWAELRLLPMLGSSMTESGLRENCNWIVGCHGITAEAEEETDNWVGVDWMAGDRTTVGVVK